MPTDTAAQHAHAVPPSAPDHTVRTPKRSGARLFARSRIILGVVLGVANVIGAVIVFVFAAWLLPTPTDIGYSPDLLQWNALAAVLYVLVATPIGVVWGRFSQRSVERWLIEDRPPTTREVRKTMAAPRQLTMIQAILWAIAAAIFATVNGVIDPTLIMRIGLTVICGGLTTSAATFLLAERVNRPVVARALADNPAMRHHPAGVTSRTIVMWALGTGIPLLGIVIAGMSALILGEGSRGGLATAMVALGATGLVIGFGVTLLSARSVAAPIRAVRRGMEQIEIGNLDVHVDVNSSTEVGLLQLGFNRMTDGLQEREQIRELFGRHVGDEVARAALATGLDLRGETRQAAVMFVDVVASTGLADRLAPHEVMALLNRFFAEVVDVVGEHDGWINKFIGDAAMAVFGVPEATTDHAGSAMAAARALAARLDRELPQLDFGIGIASGTVVAGNLGAARRYEYTVIGDPVNVASRLTDQAKRTPDRILCDDRTLQAASPEEAKNWVSVAPRSVRGRNGTVQPAVPRTGINRTVPPRIERRAD